MKRTKTYILKRFIQKIGIRFQTMVTGNRRARYPKYLSEKEKTVCDIFLNVLHNPQSVLHYNPETYECYIQSDSQKLYIFLEPQNVTVINTIYGYDTKISADLEVYLSERFKHEASKRRNIFKAEILSKVQHSLKNTLEKIQS